MSNTISLIMLGLILAVCVMFMLKMLRTPTQSKENQKWVLACFSGAAIGFVGGGLLGVLNPQLLFSNSFLRQEGGDLGAIILLALGFSVLGGVASLPLRGLFRKRS